MFRIYRWVERSDTHRLGSPLNYVIRATMQDNSNLTTKFPARQSGNRNSEYLAQRRKGRKVRRLREKIIHKSFCPFPITLAPLRLGGRNSRLRVLSIPDYLRRPRKFFTIVIRRAR